MDQRFEAGFAGALGAAAMAIVVGAAVLVAAPRVDVAITRGVVLQGLASMIVGALCAFYLAPFITASIGARHPSAEAAIGFLVGVTAWRLLPVFVALAEGFMRWRAGALRSSDDRDAGRGK